MKKITLFLILLCFTIVIQGQCTDFVTIPDTNFKAALVADTTINTDEDAEISCTEATTYRGTIDVGQMSISDLTGIEAFVNITRLDCDINSITSLDLSSNIALERVICNNNFITNLNVSNSLNLISITAYSNRLTSIDITNNLVLRSLNIHSNDIAIDLDLSNHLELTSLDCSSNDITALNVANGVNTSFSRFLVDNNDFTCIQVDDVSYSEENWSEVKDSTASFSINCSADCYVNIPDVNFKAILVANTTINTDEDDEISCDEAIAFTNVIDVKDQSISDLTGIEAFVNITGLECKNNNLTILDVSQNKALIWLGFRFNAIEEINVAENTALLSLSCANNPLKSIDVTNNTSLVSLYCYATEVSSIDVSVNTNLIALFCDENPLLTSLNVANGNNTNFLDFNVSNNPNLVCIQVDDVAYSNTNWSFFKDAIASFSIDCSATASVLDTAFSNAIKVYPNPIKNMVYITLQAGETLAKAQVYNVLGEEIINSKKKEISVNTLKNGIYLLKIENEEGKVAIRKIVKE